MNVGYSIQIGKLHILTCRDYNGGCNKHMIHTCRNPHHILPSKHSDQLAHAVIQCRTINL